MNSGFAHDEDSRHAPPDPFAISIEHALRTGWRKLPAVRYGLPLIQLVRLEGTYSDLVTLPETELGEVLRLSGGPDDNRPRFPGKVVFHHIVPVHVALQWLMTAPHTDDYLIQWVAEHHQPREVGVDR